MTNNQKKKIEEALDELEAYQRLIHKENCYNMVIDSVFDKLKELKDEES